MTRYDIAKFYGYNSPEEYDEAQRRKHEIFVESKKMQKPNAEKEPVKRGRWESSQRTIETGTVYCSNCAIEYYISDLQTVGDCNGIVHYCPNCGARMDGDTDA